MFNCVLDNEGCAGNVAVVSGVNSNGRWAQVEVCGGEKNSCGLKVEDGASLDLKRCRITHNHGNAVLAQKNASLSLWNCHVNANEGMGLCLEKNSKCNLEGAGNRITGNRKGNKKVDDSSNLIEN